MYASYPPKSRLAIRLVLTVAWLLISMGGLSAALMGPKTVAIEVGVPVLVGAGFIIALAGTVAAAGIVLGRYRLEWTASWFAGGGMIPYVAAVWWLTVTSSPTRLTQALLLTALLAFVTLRSIMCSAHATLMRSISAGPVEV